MNVSAQSRKQQNHHRRVHIRLSVCVCVCVYSLSWCNPWHTQLTCEQCQREKDYFASIPKREAPKREKIVEPVRTKEKRVKVYDANIQLPLVGMDFITPSFKERDAKVLDVISTILSNGKSSRLYKKLVDDKKMALQAGAINLSQEDYGTYIVYALPLGKVSLADLTKEIDAEIVKLQNDLISEKDYQKLQNHKQFKYF